MKDLEVNKVQNSEEASAPHVPPLPGGPVSEPRVSPSLSTRLQDACKSDFTCRGGPGPGTLSYGTLTRDTPLAPSLHICTQARDVCDRGIWLVLEVKALKPSRRDKMAAKTRVLSRNASRKLDLIYSVLDRRYFPR